MDEVSTCCRLHFFDVSNNIVATTFDFLYLDDSGSDGDQPAKNTFLQLFSVMRISKLVPLTLVLAVLSSGATCAGMTSQAGAGYGIQFRGNTDIIQYELFWREPLPYTKKFGDNWKLYTGVEAGFAWLMASPSADSATARFSLMPEVLLSFQDKVNTILGFGVGYMYGETHLPGQNLGGALLFASKVGLQIPITSRWGIEGVYYHQSNGSIYDHNASLNMLQLSLSYHF